MPGKSQKRGGSPPARVSAARAGLRTLLAFGVALGGVTITAKSATAPAGTAGEYEVKAAFLYNFAKFVEWPAGVKGPVRLCIVGDDPFGDQLDVTVRGKTVGGQPIEIQRIGRGDNPRGCQIAFIRVPDPETRSVLDALQGASTLTVGESPTFARDGGMINFVLEDQRVHFEINPGAAQRARLKISSKLLSLAKIVGN